MFLYKIAKNAYLRLLYVMDSPYVLGDSKLIALTATTCGVRGALFRTVSLGIKKNIALLLLILILAGCHSASSFM